MDPIKHHTNSQGKAQREGGEVDFAYRSSPSLEKFILTGKVVGMTFAASFVGFPWGGKFMVCSILVGSCFILP